MTMGSMPTRYSTTGDHWTTPMCVLEAVCKFNDGPVTLDPCSNPNSMVGAWREWYGPPDGIDGLVTPWIANGLIYVNPPYSQKDAWMQRCYEYGKIGQEIIALVPADTDTGWFHRYCWTAKKRCFWKGRLRFGGDSTQGARFPSVCVYFGPRARKFVEIFSAVGHCA